LGLSTVAARQSGPVDQNGRFLQVEVDEREATMSDAHVANALKAWRFLYRRGFIEGFGHISVRLPGSDRFLVTRHSAAMDATAEDFLVFDLDGNHLEGAGVTPGRIQFTSRFCAPVPTSAA
jgi:ribulose-5-phosphate 4-epimerase/fuculose-1-phosphate aldolase